MVKKKQKGVTLVETVVAMALIAIVSASIFATSSFVIKTQEKNKLKHFFENETENILMCYYSNNFSKAVSFLTGSEVVIAGGANDYTLYYNSDYEYTTEAEAMYSVKIDYTDSLNPEVIAKKVSTNDIIYDYGGENG